MANRELYCEPEQLVNPEQKQGDVNAIIIRETELLQRKAKNAKRVGMKKNTHLILYVHGFNNDEYAMNKRGTGLDTKLGTNKVITTSFNWQSYCGLFDYWSDQKRAKQCAQYFALYLQQIRAGKLHKFEQVDIIAHSMGNYALIQTILHCQQTKQLNLFSSSNIICVAADAPYDLYHSAIELVQDCISNWIHYWNSWDDALILSDYVANSAFFGKGDGKKQQPDTDDKKKETQRKPEAAVISSDTDDEKKETQRKLYRAGRRECGIQHERVQNVQWRSKKMFDHGYISDIIGNDDALRCDILAKLNLSADEEEEEEDAEDDEKESTQWIQHSMVWNELSQGNECKAGDTFWTDKGSKVDAKYGTFKLQEHKQKGSALITGIRAVAPWSNHSDKYRIIHALPVKPAQGKEVKAKWKEIYHHDNWMKVNKKFDAFMEAVKWKKSMDQ